MDRIDAATRTYFETIAQIRASGAEGANVEFIHTNLREVYGAAIEQMRASGVSDEDRHAVGYALSAFVDETMLGLSPELRGFWMTRLFQLEYFRENQAGEGFFRLLDQLMKEHGRADVLRLYYKILLLGFRGRYAIPGRELGLEELIERAAARLQSLGRLAQMPLSPHGLRPPESLTARRQWPWVTVSLAAFLGALTIFVALKIDLATRTGAAIERLESLDLGIW